MSERDKAIADFIESTMEVAYPKSIIGYALSSHDAKIVTYEDCRRDWMHELSITPMWRWVKRRRLAKAIESIAGTSGPIVQAFRMSADSWKEGE